MPIHFISWLFKFEEFTFKTYHEPIQTKNATNRMLKNAMQIKSVRKKAHVNTVYSYV